MQLKSEGWNKNWNKKSLKHWQKMFHIWNKNIIFVFVSKAWYKNKIWNKKSLTKKASLFLSGFFCQVKLFLSGFFCQVFFVRSGFCFRFVRILKARRSLRKTKFFLQNNYFIIALQKPKHWQKMRSFFC